MAAIVGNTARMMAKPNAGIVISAGKMQKTVTVRMAKQQWNRKLRKNYTVYYKLLVNDPTSAVLTGDVVTLTPERHSSRVKYTVSDILAPFAKPLSERPPLLTAEQRLAIHQEKHARKAERKAERQTLLQQGMKEGEVVDDGNVEVVAGTTGKGVGKGKVLEHGREVLPGGQHKFGKINDEARKGKARAQELVERGSRNEAEREQLVVEPR